MRKMPPAFFADGFLLWETERKRDVTELAFTSCQPYLMLWGGMAASERLRCHVGEGMLHPPKNRGKGKLPVPWLSLLRKDARLSQTSWLDPLARGKWQQPWAWKGGARRSEAAEVADRHQQDSLDLYCSNHVKGAHPPRCTLHASCRTRPHGSAVHTELGGQSRDVEEVSFVLQMDTKLVSPTAVTILHRQMDSWDPWNEASGPLL